MREVKERISDFNEIYTTYDFNTIKPLLDKCHNCSEPFCSKKLVINKKPLGISLKSTTIEYGSYPE